MSKVKSISKRTLALILSLLMLLSSGIVGTLAANVELAPTGVNHSGGYIYFLKPSTWTDSTVMMFIGHDSYTSVYTMTKVSNTDNLYRYTMPSWSGATSLAFANASSAWGTGSWGPDNRKNASHYTNVYNNYGFNSNNYYLWKPGGTSNDTGITPSNSTAVSLLNKTTKANVYSTTVDGTSYTSNASAGTVTVSGYGMSAYNTASAVSSTSTASTAYASASIAVGSTAKFTATAKDGYEFEGWYSSSTITTPLSTNPEYTYSYNISTTAYTVYAKFREVVTDATVTFKNGTATHTTQTVAIGDAPTTPTAPTKTGYTFQGWSLTDGGAVVTVEDQTITKDTTFYAVWDINEYTVTFNDYDGTFLGTDTVEHGSTAEAPVTPSRTGYTFDGWSESLTNVTGNMTVTAQYTINTYKLTISGFDSTKADLVIDGTTYFDDDVISKSYGETASVTITPNEGQVLTVNGEEVTYGESYEATITFDKDQTLTLGFNIKTFNVTITHDWGRSESVYIGTTQYGIGPTSVTNLIPYGTQTLKITAPENYYIESVVGNGVNYNDDGSMADYKEFDIFVTSDCEITIKLQSMPKYGLNISQSGFTAEDSTSGYVLTVNGTDVSTGDPNATVETEQYAGEYTIRVHAPENYYISALNGQPIDVEVYIEPYYELEYTVNLTAETDVNITYSKDPYVEITGDINGSTEFIENDYFNYGSTYTINVPAKEGYYISRVTGTINGDSVNLTSQDYSNSTFTQEVDFLENDIDLVVYYTAIPTFNVTVAVNDANGGTATGTGIKDGVVTVYSGSKAYLSATANTGYLFTGWTVDPADAVNTALVDLSQLAIDFVPQEDVIVTANFAPVTGTINVTAGEGGTVTNSGTNNVTYPETITATATGDASQGYEFTHWTVESAGEADVDYIVTENDNVITVQILTQDTVVNVTANFANSQKIKVYTYSDNGFDTLTMTESNGTTTQTPVNNVVQSPITFGDESWYTPGEVSLTAGFYDEITAQMSGGSQLTGGTGKLVMFKNTKGWEKVYFYSSSSSLYVTDVMGKDSNAVSTKNSTAYPMTRIGTTDYWYIYTSNSTNYMAFSKDAQSNYDWLYTTEASYPYKGGTVTGSYSTSTPCFTPTTSQTWNTNSTTYYNSGAWGAIPDFPTETGVIDITSELYEGNVWKELDEIWIYIKSDGKYIATSTNRRQLLDYVGSALIKRTYNNGVNDMEYIASLWTAFVNAYTAALDAAGDHTLTEAELKTKYDALVTAYENLDVEPNIKITGSHGAEPHTSSSTYYGKTSFPEIETSTGSGNIGDQNDTEYYDYTTSYIYATIERGTTVTINTNLESAYEADYLVYGWVVNGTEWVPATQDIQDTSLYVGSYTCNKSAVIVPIYFRKSTIENWETDDSIIKIYANTEGASSKWGNYISAYTWMNPKSYYQFGHWTGQLMIPDTANPGMYYTFVETTGPSGQQISGIAFTNYGSNKPINTNDRYQTYDYYEFIELAEQDYNNIVFKLKTIEGNDNYPKADTETLASYNFDYFRDFSGSLIDINREKIVEERTIPEPALYIVRTGPVKYSEGAGEGWGSLDGSDFYVDAYLYKPDGTYIGRCKSYELTNLEKLKETRGIDLTTEEYTGKPVMIDYASLTTDSGSNKRFDGEWYGTKYGLTNVTIKTEVAFQNEQGEIEYFQGQNNVDGVGQAYFNGEHFQEVPHASEGHTINAIVAEGNDFVGWYKAIVADDGSYTIDTTANPLFIERSATIDASADAVYVAVFKEHPEGTFTVNNYYYTYKDFEGQPMGEHLPPVFGGDSSYSIRDVKIQKIKNYDNSTLTDKDNPGFAGTYTQSMEVAAGDVLEITIKTTPTYTRDYVYAWYIQANEADGKINFEEIGTNVIQDDYEPGASKEFTFTYTVEEGVNNITIYSDVVHITPEVTFTYIYNNRYNETKTYVVKYTLTNGELTNYTPSNETIRDLAPYVGDIYKNVTWEIENISSDATNWTLRATETDIYTVNVNVNGEVLDPPITGRFNETVSIYAKDIDDTVTGNMGIWYLNNDDDPDFDPAVDEILGYGTYYGLVITGDADVYFTSVDELMNQIILADAVYGYERATDGSGNETINKVYVDYLISMLLNVYTGGFIDVNGNGVQDTETEPTVIDEENTNTPVSLKAIEAAGYEVDYGMVHELLNTFGDNKDDIIEEFYGNESTAMSDASLTQMLIDNKATANGATDSTGALATLLYKYSAIDYKDYATNKNRVIMTFGFDNTEYYRNLYYNVKAYLTISAPETTTMTDDNTFFLFSNSATLNIAEDDKITNGEATNS